MDGVNRKKIQHKKMKTKLDWYFCAEDKKELPKGYLINQW